MSHQAPLAMWLIFFEKLLDVALSAPFLPSLPVPVSIYFCVYHLEHYSLYHFCYHRMEVIDKCFSHDTVEEIVDALVSYDSAAFSFFDIDRCLIDLLISISQFIVKLT